MNEQSGERITVEDANKYFKAYEQVKMGIARFTPPAGLTGPDEIMQHELGSAYAKSKFNCFIFKRTIIDELMALKDREGKTPEYLLIHFAAHPKDKPNPGEPTLVIMGCNKDKDGDYISMNDTKPGGETPGKIVQAAFPPEFVSDTIVFKLNH